MGSNRSITTLDGPVFTVLSQKVSDCQDMVFLISTEFDDASLSSMYNFVRTGQVDLVLEFGSGTPVNPLELYVYANVQRSISIVNGGRAFVYDG